LPVANSNSSDYGIVEVVLPEAAEFDGHVSASSVGLLLVLQSRTDPV
jgi:hypothetical protein